MSGIPANSRDHGVRVIRSEEISQGGAGDLAVRLVAELSHAPGGHGTLAARSLELAPGASQAPPHQGPTESVICVISGRATIRWGESLESCCTAGPGDLVVIPARVPHQEDNAGGTEALRYLLLTT